VLYHLFSHVTAAAIAGFMGLYGAAGTSEVSTCFIRQHSRGIYFMILPVFLYYPIALFASIYAAASFRSSQDVKHKVYLLRYTLVMAVYALGWLPMGALYIEDILRVSHSGRAAEPICMGLSSAAGLVANIIRFSDPAVMGKTKRYLKTRYSIAMANSSLLQTDVVDFFQGLLREVTFTQGALCAILSLHYYLSQGSHADSPSIRLQFSGDSLIGDSDGMIALRKRCKGYLVRSYHFSITEREPSVFFSLRQASNSDLIASLDPEANEKVLKRNIGNRGGRSAAFILVTHDRKLVLKSLSKGERELLTERMLPDYVRRVSRKESLMAKILGVFTLRTSKGLKQHIAVMENILSGGDITAIFDMKGSRLARKRLKHNEEVAVETLPSYETYKDLDFFQTQKRLFLAPNDVQRLRRGVAADVEMLRSFGIMDYSLLIAIAKSSSSPSQYLYPATGPDQGRVYFMGVIDYLQLYSNQKRLEGLGKSLLNSAKREEISSVDPQIYAKRFVKLVEQVLGVRAAQQEADES
jgi:hypothetical protein